MAAPSLAALVEELETLSERFPARLDAFGTLTLVHEGGHGGAPFLLWAPWALGPALLRALSELPFRGSAFLALAPAPRDQVPFQAVLSEAGPRYVLFLTPEGGIVHRFAGYKLVAPGEKAPLEDPRPPLVERRLAPTGLAYRETRLYPPWESPALPGAREGEAPLGALAQSAGALAFGVGIGELGRVLAELGLL